MPAQEAACTLDSGGLRLAGMLHVPAAAPAAAVLIGNPLFEERKSAQRPLVETARILADAGLAVLRFDYRGCGDSEGDFSDVTAGDWMADIQAAAGWLKSRFAALPLGLLGLRLGATLALTAGESPDQPACDFAVLWEPVVHGRQDLEQEWRRKLLKEMMTFGRTRVTREALNRDLAEGRTIDFDGYPVTPALVRSLDGIRLDRPFARVPRRVQIVGIGPTARVPPAYEALGEALGRQGCVCDVAARRDVPFWNQVGLASCHDLARETAQWMRRALGDAA